MKKRAEYHFTISTSNKTKNFSVPYRQISNMSQSTHTSSHMDSGIGTNYEMSSGNSFIKSSEEDQFRDFITSKRIAFDLPIFVNNDCNSNFLDKSYVNQQVIQDSTSTLGLICETDSIIVETNREDSEFYEESKLSEGFNSSRDI